MGDAKNGVEKALADAKAETALADAKRGPVRRRAVGTRDHIITHLRAVDEITDATGMASTRLAEAVGYPGSSVAFAQLLSGMERDGLIVREVRGKRTYRITLPEDARGQAPAGVPQESVPAAGILAPGIPAPGIPAPGIPAGLQSAAGAAAVRDLVPVAQAPGFDYDELARRLLVQVIRRLAATSGDVGEPAAVDAASAVGELTAENARLREQLSQVQRDLAVERTRRAQVTGELNQAEVVLLERLLNGPGDGEAQRPGANAS